MKTRPVIPELQRMMSGTCMENYERARKHIYLKTRLNLPPSCRNFQLVLDSSKGREFSNMSHGGGRTLQIVGRAQNMINQDMECPCTRMGACRSSIDQIHGRDLAHQSLSEVWNMFIVP